MDLGPGVGRSEPIVGKVDRRARWVSESTKHFSLLNLIDFWAPTSCGASHIVSQCYLYFLFFIDLE